MFCNSAYMYCTQYWNVFVIYNYYPKYIFLFRIHYSYPMISSNESSHVTVCFTTLTIAYTLYLALLVEALWKYELVQI